MWKPPSTDQCLEIGRDEPTALDPSLSTRDLVLFASLFLLESSIAVMSAALYMKGERSFEAFLSSRPGLAFLFTVFIFLVSSAGIIHMYLARKRLQLRHFHLIVTMNLITVLLLLVTSEVAMRLLCRPSPQGETLGSMVLAPKNWGGLPAPIVSSRKPILSVPPCLSIAWLAFVQRFISTWCSWLGSASTVASVV